jgi:hypothetical protein
LQAAAVVVTTKWAADKAVWAAAELAVLLLLRLNHLLQQIIQLQSAAAELAVIHLKAAMELIHNSPL